MTFVFYNYLILELDSVMPWENESFGKEDLSTRKLNRQMLEIKGMVKLW